MLQRFADPAFFSELSNLAKGFSNFTKLGSLTSKSKIVWQPEEVHAVILLPRTQKYEDASNPAGTAAVPDSADARVAAFLSKVMATPEQKVPAVALSVDKADSSILSEMAAEQVGASAPSSDPATFGDPRQSAEPSTRPSSIALQTVTTLSTVDKQPEDNQLSRRKSKSPLLTTSSTENVNDEQVIATHLTAAQPRRSRSKSGEPAIDSTDRTAKETTPVLLPEVSSPRDSARYPSLPALSAVAEAGAPLLDSSIPAPAAPPSSPPLPAVPAFRTFLASPPNDQQVVAAPCSPDRISIVSSALSELSDNVSAPVDWARDTRSTSYGVQDHHDVVAGPAVKAIKEVSEREAFCGGDVDADYDRGMSPMLDAPDAVGVEEPALPSASADSISALAGFAQNSAGPSERASAGPADYEGEDAKDALFAPSPSGSIIAIKAPAKRKRRSDAVWMQPKKKRKSGKGSGRVVYLEDKLGDDILYLPNLPDGEDADTVRSTAVSFRGSA